MDQEVDPVVKEFSNILDELSFNSRPIITTLTKIAEEHISCAQYFVDLLESRIEKCVPKQKLYSFYALDSICKNAGSPYTIFFSRNLFNLYKKTYLLVDNTTRTKLINMFKTWMTPNESSGGLIPLFETSALEKIENFLIKASALHQKNFQNMLPTPTVPLLLREIDKLSLLTNERLKNQANDEKLKIKLMVLSQLKQELQKEKLTMAALKQVQIQLKQVFAQDQQVLQQQHMQDQYNKQQQQQQIQQQQQQQQQQLQQQDQQQFQQHSSSDSNDLSKSGTPIVPLFGNSNNMEIQSSLFGNITRTFTPPNFSEIDKNNKLEKIRKLYNELREIKLIYEPSKESIVTLYDKLGGNPNSRNILNTNSNANNNNNSNNTIVMRKLPSIELLTDILRDSRAYMARSNNSELLNSIHIQLSDKYLLNNDNKEIKNNFINLLYRNKSNKCKLCGKRFGNSAEEKRSYSNHLDWHFRINKRIKGTTVNSSNNNGSSIKSSSKNIQSRNWYLENTQWIKFKDDEIISTQSISNNNNNNNNTNNSNTNNNSNNNSNIKSNVETGGDNTQKNVTGRNKRSINQMTYEGNSIKEKSIKTKYVIVPENTNEEMNYKCSICKEIVNASYDDELGEWIWKNTLEENGKYYHSTCFNETIKNRENDEDSTGLKKLRSMISEGN